MTKKSRRKIGGERNTYGGRNKHKKKRGVWKTQT
jgi:hypothetical protein